MEHQAYSVSQDVGSLFRAFYQLIGQNIVHEVRREADVPGILEVSLSNPIQRSDLVQKPW
jgi:hypothetical protein